MGVIDKVKFWDRGGDDLDLDSELPPIGDPLAKEKSYSDPMQTDSFSSANYPSNNFDQQNSLDQPFNRPPPMQQSAQLPQALNNQDGNLKTGIEMLSAKLDSIKSDLTLIDQRLKKIEELALQDQNSDKKKKGRDPWAHY